jgi:hypothetical protein
MKITKIACKEGLPLLRKNIISADIIEGENPNFFQLKSTNPFRYIETISARKAKDLIGEFLVKEKKETEKITNKVTKFFGKNKKGNNK